MTTNRLYKNITEEEKQFNETYDEIVENVDSKLAVPQRFIFRVKTNEGPLRNRHFDEFTTRLFKELSENHLRLNAELLKIAYDKAYQLFNILKEHDSNKITSKLRGHIFQLQSLAVTRYQTNLLKPELNDEELESVHSEISRLSEESNTPIVETEETKETEETEETTNEETEEPVEVPEEEATEEETTEEPTEETNEEAPEEAPEEETNEEAPQEEEPTEEPTEEPEEPTEEPTEEEPEESDELQVGDKIEIKPNRRGQIKWVGEAEELGPGTWYAVRLTEKRGTCDGNQSGVEHFKCPDGFGVYCQQKLIIGRLSEENTFEEDFMSEEAEQEKLKQEYLEKIRKNEEKLRHIQSRFKSLDEDGNGTLDMTEFLKFACAEDVLGCSNREGRGLFREIDISDSNTISFAEFENWLEKIGGLETIEPETKEPETEPEETKEEEAPTETSEEPAPTTTEDKVTPIKKAGPKVGDKYKLADGKSTGTLKFIGKVKFDKGMFYGFELDIGFKGKNNGAIKNVKYFDCKRDRGLFLNTKDFKKCKKISLKAQKAHQRRRSGVKTTAPIKPTTKGKSTGKGTKPKGKSNGKGKSTTTTTKTPSKGKSTGKTAPKGKRSTTKTTPSKGKSTGKTAPKGKNTKSTGKSTKGKTTTNNKGKSPTKGTGKTTKPKGKAKPKAKAKN